MARGVGALNLRARCASRGGLAYSCRVWDARPARGVRPTTERSDAIRRELDASRRVERRWQGRRQPRLTKRAQGVEYDRRQGGRQRAQTARGWSTLLLPN